MPPAWGLVAGFLKFLDFLLLIGDVILWGSDLLFLLDHLLLLEAVEVQK